MMLKQKELFEKASLSDLPTARDVLAEMGRIAMNGMRDVDRISAGKLYLEKIKDFIDDGSEGGNIEITFTVRKSVD